jgi:predicted molibdopterin-dependent oxidoreductase YjgC
LTGRQAANQLTNRALDPLSKIPEYKVSAVRIERVGPAGTAVVDDRDMDLVERHTRGDEPGTPPSEPGEGGG